MLCKSLRCIRILIWNKNFIFSLDNDFLDCNIFVVVVVIIIPIQTVILFELNLSSIKGIEIILLFNPNRPFYQSGHVFYLCKTRQARQKSSHALIWPGWTCSGSPQFWFDWFNFRERVNVRVRVLGGKYLIIFRIRWVGDDKAKKA